ncbi:MAG: fructosamine kinase family protein [Planctomycetes bacterium]|nr:fructosamine kinase family protein [Planctomycetota bacterium]
MSDPVEAALGEHGIDVRVRSRRSLGGGCIHDVERIELEDGRAFVAKCNHRRAASAFEEERAGLEALDRTRTVLVPKPLGVSRVGERAVFLLEALEPADSVSSDVWRRFGVELAALHAAGGYDRYGFDHDNHVGATSQPNPWTRDWVEFNREHRIGHQVRLAERAGLLRGAERRSLERLVERLDRILPARPRPSLLHGDLWSGNALPVRVADGGVRVALIDPAVSVGDGWADIAMMQLFGGFPESCHRAYAEAQDDQDRVEERLGVYRLYHVLNHLNLFGRSYAARAVAIADALCP